MLRNFNGCARKLWLRLRHQAGGVMRKVAAIVLLFAACSAPTIVNADGMDVKHRTHFARGCAFAGRIFSEGEFCALECHFTSCITQTCHRGRWVIPPATCPAGFGCPQFC
jgi:hypothetical protein